MIKIYLMNMVIIFENELLNKGYEKIYTDEKTDYVYKNKNEKDMYFQIQDINGICSEKHCPNEDNNIEIVVTNINDDNCLLDIYNNELEDYNDDLASYNQEKMMVDYQYRKANNMFDDMKIFTNNQIEEYLNN